MAEEQTLKEEEARTLLRLSALALGDLEIRTHRRGRFGFAEIDFAQLWERLSQIADYQDISLPPQAKAELPDLIAAGASSWQALGRYWPPLLAVDIHSLIGTPIDSDNPTYSLTSYGWDHYDQIRHKTGLPRHLWDQHFHVLLLPDPNMHLGWNELTPPGPLARRTNLTLTQLMEQVLLPLQRYEAPQVPHPETSEMKAWPNLHWQSPVVYTSLKPIEVADGTWLQPDERGFMRHVEALHCEFAVRLDGINVQSSRTDQIVSRRVRAQAATGLHETWVVSTAAEGGWREGLDWALEDAYQVARRWTIPAGASLKDFTAKLKQGPPRRVVVVLPPQKNEPGHPPSMEMISALSLLLSQADSRGTAQHATEVLILKAPEVPTPADAPDPIVMDIQGNWRYRLAHALQS